MNESNRGTMVTGIVLVALGALFIVLNLVPGVTAGKTWPLIFIVLAIGFFLPALVWPKSREGLAGLFIPGSVLLVLGAIFLFNTLTNIWSVWAIAWILIPASVGFGLLSGAWAGKWDHNVFEVGKWMLIISLSVFALLAALFGNVTVKIIGAVLLVGTGIFMLVRSFTKKQAAE
jgi:hypothetical protein